MGVNERLSKNLSAFFGEMTVGISEPNQKKFNLENSHDNIQENQFTFKRSKLNDIIECNKKIIS